jgi:hypothetical protein
MTTGKFPMRLRKNFADLGTVDIGALLESLFQSQKNIVKLSAETAPALSPNALTDFSARIKRSVSK